MENLERAASEERKWRIRVATLFLAMFAVGWGILAVGLLVTGATQFQVLIGLFLLVLLTFALAYYFGAVVKRILAIPFPESRFAGVIAKRLVWLICFMLMMGLLGAYPLLAGWYSSSPSPRKEIVTGGVTASLFLIVVLVFAIQRWRAAIIKIGEAVKDRRP